MQSWDPHYHHHHHHHHHHQHDHDQELCPQSLAPGSPALGELHLLTATKARLPQVSCFIFSSSPHTPFLPPLFPYPYDPNQCHYQTLLLSSILLAGLCEEPCDGRARCGAEQQSQRDEPDPCKPYFWQSHRRRDRQSLKVSNAKRKSIIIIWHLSFLSEVTKEWLEILGHCKRNAQELRTFSRWPINS